MVLPYDFYRQDVLTVAPQLLGKLLVCRVGSQRVSGMITETEAYRGTDDQACHARAGKTPRTQIMFGPAGRAYVYFTYGMHWMFNCVCGPEGYPAAVLIRAIQPTEGLDIISGNRPGVKPALWCNGPAKVTRALAIHQRHNGLDLCSTQAGLWIEDIENSAPVSAEAIQTAPRVGIFSVPEPWRSMPWNFSLDTRR